MRLIFNCHDDVAFERVVNTPPRGVGERTVDSIREHARANSISMWASSKALISEQQLTTRSGNAVSLFLNLINEMTNSLEALPLPEITENVLEMSGLIDMHRREKGERGQSRVENLEELIGACKNFSADQRCSKSLNKQHVSLGVFDKCCLQTNFLQDTLLNLLT